MIRTALLSMFHPSRLRRANRTGGRSLPAYETLPGIVGGGTALSRATALADEWASTTNVNGQT
jgi:hypothetical protein